MRRNEDFMNVLLCIIIAFGLGCLCMYLITQKEIAKKSGQLQKNKKYVELVNQWLILKHSNMKLETELKRRGIHEIAVYGMGICGRHLIRELATSDITMAYAMDKKNMDPYHGIEVRKLQKELPVVDAIVNTVINDNSVINEEIKKYFSCPIITLEDLVYESYVVEDDRI